MSDTISEADAKMAASVAHTKEEFAGIRTGRAHPAMFNKITAVYYGAPTPLQQLATVQVADARMVLITPFDQNAINGIEKAIRDSDLGVNPATDGNQIRVSLPELTEERRKEYTKLAKSKAEEGRVAVRNSRRQAKDALDKLVKDKEVGEDEVSRAEKDLDARTKKYTEQIDELLKNKETELLEV
ncbi:ribosome recycling factor [Naumannella halotolerans]|uniref:ribosome recycling factor n=1 Tax=Naumannella halotolerans TaxID=993414 RepID=UPI001AAE3067|nr:ribosome recycling factor [Naumannella halotolerans]